MSSTSDPTARRVLASVGGSDRGRNGSLRQLADPRYLTPAGCRRRALMLLGVTVVAPGSAQLAVGRRRIGRVALRVWLVLWLVVAAAVLVAWVDRGLALRLAVGMRVLGWLPSLLTVLAVAWVGLFLDAWRLGRPPLLTMGGRRLVALTTAGLVAATVVPLGWAARQASAGNALLQQVFAGSQEASASHGRYNVLLLGGDAGEDRVGLRPDSITLASIDATTGRTVLLSFPRNLQNVPFPDGSPMHRALPRGLDCGDDCLLNSVYTWAQSHPQVYGRDERDPGARATAEAVSAISGLDVHYMVLVDLQGFRDLVDAVGGVRIDVRRPLPIGGRGQVLPAGTRTLDGYHALWYARSRSADSDYARMARQRCVMTAMVDQLDPGTVLTRFQRIAAASTGLVRTTIPVGELGTFAELASAAKSQPVTSVQFAPPLITPARPDYDRVRVMVRTAIEDSTRAGGARPTPARASASTPVTPGAAPGSAERSPSGSSPGGRSAVGADPPRAECAAA
ncbi:MAG: LCP family protein [Angustibacter sp.]